MTAVPETKKAAVSLSAGFGMTRPADLMNGMMKPKTVIEVSKPVKHNFGMKPKPDTSLSIARIQQQNLMTRDAEAKRIHAKQIEEASRKKQLEEEKLRQREAADNAAKMKM